MTNQFFFLETDCICTETRSFLFSQTYSQVSLQHVHKKAINSPAINQMPGQTTEEPCRSEQIVFPMLFNVFIGQHEHLKDHINIILSKKLRITCFHALVTTYRATLVYICLSATHILKFCRVWLKLDNALV